MVVGCVLSTIVMIIGFFLMIAGALYDIDEPPYVRQSLAMTVLGLIGAMIFGFAAIGLSHA
jgi:hypothetical protein